MEERRQWAQRYVVHFPVGSSKLRRGFHTVKHLFLDLCTFTKLVSFHIHFECICMHRIIQSSLRPNLKPSHTQKKPHTGALVLCEVGDTSRQLRVLETQESNGHWWQVPNQTNDILRTVSYPKTCSLVNQFKVLFCRLYPCYLMFVALAILNSMFLFLSLCLGN